MQYPIAIFKNNDECHVIIPDIPELTVQGVGMAQTIFTTRNTIINHLHDLVQKNIEFSHPRPISEHIANPDYAGCIWAVVSVELSRIIGEVAELNIRLPMQLVSYLYRTYPDKDINQIILDALKAQNILSLSNKMNENAI